MAEYILIFEAFHSICNDNDLTLRSTSLFILLLNGHTVMEIQVDIQQIVRSVIFIYLLYRRFKRLSFLFNGNGLNTRSNLH